ncbi:hypothetical protein LCGC14_1991480 [marine sediment metagenome]|uniref:Uncharacterized protein n=1 Tax=marine sediment metagenome TaxID=412755 RepID=A0A0F9FU23_9ZZZZ
MSLIVQARTYRGKILDHGVAQTKNGFPQFEGALQAVEAYDEEEKQWVNWADVEQKDITAFLVLFGSKGETLTNQQLKKVTGWDGLSFQALAAMDLSEVGIQFRVEENTYEDKTTLQVSWIDEYDAEPGRSVRKLDAAGLKAIDAQYASMLKQSAAKKAPAKAGKTATAPGKVTAKNTKATAKKGPVTQKKQDPPKEPETDESKPDLPSPTDTEATLQPPETDTEQTPTDAYKLPTSCIKKVAWDTSLAARKDGFGDTAFSEKWAEAVAAVDDGKGSKNFDETEWGAVLHYMIDSPVCV